VFYYPAPAELNSLKLSSKGQVTISAHARRQLKLKPATNLLEVVINNCLILIPQDEVLSDILLKAKESIKKIGVNKNQFKKAVAKRQSKNLSKRYPKLLDG
jgi:bifunctional DNA-binding transcriptional regulator/antitoxin component of YhaV-PrlF toxin-antitoxin module